LTSYGESHGKAIGGVIDLTTNIRKIFNPEWFARKQLETMKAMLDETQLDE
jgi:chorismate synthase